MSHFSFWHIVSTVIAEDIFFLPKQKSGKTQECVLVLCFGVFWYHVLVLDESIFSVFRYCLVCLWVYFECFGILSGFGIVSVDIVSVLVLHFVSVWHCECILSVWYCEYFGIVICQWFDNVSVLWVSVWYFGIVSVLVLRMFCECILNILVLWVLVAEAVFFWSHMDTAPFFYFRIMGFLNYKHKMNDDDYEMTRTWRQMMVARFIALIAMEAGWVGHLTTGHFGDIRQWVLTATHPVWAIPVIAWSISYV